MKPLHILVLVAAGAVGGALIMKVAQRPEAEATAEQPQEQAPTQPVQHTVPQTPQAPAVAAEQAPPGREEPAALSKPQPEPPSHPSPFIAPKEAASREGPAREAPRRGRMQRRIPPVLIARNRSVTPASPVPTSSPAPVLASTPEPAPVKEEPAPQPTLPARPEPENLTPAPPPAPEPHRVTLNAGILIPVRLVDGLSSERNMPGDPFTATLDRELVVDGFVIAERGARVEGRVVASDRGGKVKGIAGLSVELTRLSTSDGQNVAIQTDAFQKNPQQTRMRDAEKVGTGAAIGAVIGAIAGGGKGAAIGAGVGGGAGAGDVLLTRGDAARLPSETRISFRLRAPVTLTERLPG